MPIIGRGRKSIHYLKGITSSQINYSDIDTDMIDTDLSSTSANHDTFVSAKAAKDYIDTLTGSTVASLGDTTITSPGDAALLLYDTGTSKWRDAALSGDATISDTGVISIASGVIVDADVNASAAIAISKTALVAGTGITLSTNTLNVDAAQTGINSILAADIKIGEDDQTKIDFETADTINFYAGNEKQLILTDGALTPGANAIVDLGTDALEFKDAYFDGTVEADAITIGGTAIGSIYSPIAGSSSILTTGALDAGSITSGFGAIDNGASTITTTGLISGGSLDIDNVLINGTTIGHTDDTDLITLANGVVTVAGEISVTTLDIGGTNVTSTAAELNLLAGVSGLVQADLTKLAAVDSTAAEINLLNGVSGLVQADLTKLAAIDATATEINLLDALDRGSILYGNSSGVTAVLGQGGANQVLTSDGTDIAWQDAAAATTIPITANNSTDETVYPVFVDGATGSQGLESDTGLTYNPSTGVLTATTFSGAFTGTVTDASHVTITDNESTNENNLIPFVEDAASSTGNHGLEMDGDFHYNPSTGTVTATAFAGNITGNVTGNTSGTAATVTGATQAAITTLANVTTVGALDAGSITSGFTSIDVGSGAITTTGTITAGNLTVNGTTTTVNSTTVTIDDPIFTLGGDSAPGSDDNKDRGIEFRWHNGSAAKVGFFGYDDSAGKFTFIPDATNSSEVFSGTAGTIVANLEGNVTGNVTGDTSGSSGSTTGNAATATILATARTIGGTSFNGSADIVPATITVADTTDTTSFVALFESATGDLAPKTDAGITYNAGTGMLTATGFTGPLTGNVTGNVSGSAGSATGNAATATALASGSTIGMTGDVVWTSASFDGSGNVTGTAAIGTGVIVNADVNASAAIADTKLATISTAGKVDLAALEIDGGTDIGEALVDADLFIVDNGAGGTNRKMEASRLKTYIAAADEGFAIAMSVAL